MPSTRRRINVQASQNLKPGNLVLAQILVVSDEKLKLKLPFDSIAFADFKSLGNHFLAFIKSQSFTLSDVFSPNQLICARIEKKIIKKSQVSEFEVTLDPSEINSILLPKNLSKNIVMQGFITSFEDHGAIVDIGFNSFIGFISKNASHADLNYKFGLLVVTQNHFDSSRVINLDWKSQTCCDAVDNEFLEKNFFYSFLPGTIVSSTIDCISDRFITCTNKNSTMKIFTNNIEQNIGDLKTGLKIDTCILFSSQEQEITHGSTRNYIMKNYLDLSNNLLNYHIGQTLKAMHLFDDSSMSTRYYRIKDILAFETLNDKHEIKAKIAKRSLVNSRILDINLLENIFKISTKRSTLSQKYINISEVQIGSIVNGTVFKKTEKGLVIALSKNVFGIIYSYLFSDDSTKTFTSSKVGQSIQCFVLNKETTGLNQRLILTSKASMMSSNFCLKSPTDIEKGMELNGVVLKTFDKGLLVLLPFGLKGWLRVPSNSQSEKFFQGKTIATKVIKVNKELDKIFLALNLQNRLSVKNIGKTVDCKIIQIDSNSCKVSFTVNQKEFIGTIDWYHFSDFNSTSRAIFNSLCFGYEFSAKIFAINDEGEINLTCKPLWMKFIGNINIDKKSNRNYEILVGFIENYLNEAEFVIKLDNQKIITFPVPKNLSFDNSDIIGNTIVLKSKKKGDIQHYKILNSKILDHIFPSHDLLNNFISFKLDILRFNEKLMPLTSSVGLGDSVSNKSTLNDNSMAICSSSSKKLTSKLSSNIILDYDSINKSYIISDDSNLFKFSNKDLLEKENHLSNEIIDQMVEVKIHWTTPEYAIATTVYKDSLILVYISRLQINSFSNENKLNIKIGQNLAVIIKGQVENYFIGIPATSKLKSKNYLIVQKLRESTRNSLKRSITQSSSCDENKKSSKVGRYFTEKIPDKFELSDDNISEDSMDTPASNAETNNFIGERENTNLNIENEIDELSESTSFDPNHPSNYLIKCNKLIQQNKINDGFNILSEALSKISFEKKTSRLMIYKALINLHLMYNSETAYESLINDATKEIGSAIIYKHVISAAENLSKFDIVIKYCYKLSKFASLSTKQGLESLKYIIDLCILNYTLLGEHLLEIINQKKSFGGKFLLEFKTYAASQLLSFDENLACKLFDDMCFNNPKKPELYIAYIVGLSKKNSNGDSQASSILKRFLATKPKPRVLQLLKSKLDPRSCKKLVKLIDTMV